MNKYSPLSGKKVIVLGGTSGIGLAVVEAALHQGAIVFVGSSSQGKVDNTVRELSATFSGKVHGQVADILKKESLKNFVDFVVGTGEKGIDHIIWTAGGLSNVPNLNDLDIKAVHDVFNSRIYAVLTLVSIAKDHLNKGASITLTSGTAGHHPPPGWGIVASACGAIESLAKGLAIDLAPVRVNAVTPGAILTPLWDAFGEGKSAAIKGFESSLVLEEIGQPVDAAHAYIFLASSAFTTGQVVVVDGGQLIK